MLKDMFFKRNGGLLLQQQMSSGDDGNIDKTKLFTSKDLEKATDHFNKNRILGQGGQGTVYKGILTDEVPLLVYEFIHDPNEYFHLTWDIRLRIATKIGAVLSSLHSAPAMPIYHCDTKCLNLDGRKQVAIELELMRTSDRDEESEHNINDVHEHADIWENLASRIES
ncbi:hypothetical protein R6Q59_013574 [Mikania micrantha]